MATGHWIQFVHETMRGIKAMRYCIASLGNKFLEGTEMGDIKRELEDRAKTERAGALRRPDWRRGRQGRRQRLYALALHCDQEATQTIVSMRKPGNASLDRQYLRYRRRGGQFS